MCHIKEQAMETLIPFSSLLFQDIVSTTEMRSIWTDEKLVQKWMDVERAVTESQAELGMISQAVSRKISKKLSLEHLSVERIHEKKKLVGHLMVAFLKAFRDVCGQAAEHFHLGPTTQDILDTGLTLQMKEAHQIIMGKMLKLEQMLCEKALKYRQTIMMGRTHQQHAVPTTFGFIMAAWASEICDHIERAKDSEKRWLFGNLSAVVGTQNSFVELSDANTARKLQKIFCSKLGLKSPPISLHSRTDRFSEVVNNLAELCSSLGRIGLNIRDWQRSEVMEVEEPYKKTQHSSSTLPNKRNPESSEIVEGLATVARTLALGVQDIQISLTRDGIRIPIIFICIPLSYMLASRALETVLRNIAELVVHKDNMLINLNHPNVLHQASAERIMFAIYRKTGKKAKAHTILHRCARKSHEDRISFKKVLLDDKEVGKLFTEKELDQLMDLRTYIGTATQQIEKTIRIIKEKRDQGISKIL
jgi:adenylosuccinate lyase